ncbi:MAG: RNA pseudouridine synthase [Saprospiraceae bacterium]|nr:RNA pseudouridine synthase [Saprospiraceae bacterium]MCB9324276.1 RNA pseudouridine synthase [Lewinellaceae bacterium]
MTEQLNIGELVLYKNNQLIAFNKPAGIPVQADTTGDKSMLELGEIYTKSKLHLVHRIDRPVSGVVLFAKTSGALVFLNEQFKTRQLKKTYWAVVQEKPPKEEDTLEHFVIKNSKKNISFADDKEQAGSKQSSMRYKLLGSIERYHLLEISLESGRHHQIRAQLAAIGCPVKGDVKYGARRGNKDRSIHLHARQLEFIHPVSGEIESIVAEPADEVIWNAFREKGVI